MSMWPLRIVQRDDQRVLQLKCPQCAKWQDISAMQLDGKAKIECVRCNWVGKYNGRTEELDGRD